MQAGKRTETTIVVQKWSDRILLADLFIKNFIKHKQKLLLRWALDWKKSQDFSIHLSESKKRLFVLWAIRHIQPWKLSS
jgi:hypothetical protein